MLSPITYGGVFAVTREATRPLRLWDSIAVVNRPGIPIIVDPACARNTIYFINVAPDSPRLLGRITDIGWDD